MIDLFQPGDPGEDRAQSQLFGALSRELLRAGNGIRFQARGASMSPAIRDGEVVRVEPADLSRLRPGDILLVKSEIGFRLHRLVVADLERDVFITRGDCAANDDAAVSSEEILGTGVGKEVRVGRRWVLARFKGGRTVRVMATGQRSLRKLYDIASSALHMILAERSPSQAETTRPGVIGLLTLLLMLLAVSHSAAQVAVDATTSGSATMSGTSNLTFAHTTAGTNRLLIVGVSINITNRNTGAVVSITYNGTALNLIGAHNDAGGTRRVEMWSLLAPSTGNHNVVVRTAVGGVNEGVVAGATTFTGVDQTVPLGTFVSADGANGGNSQLDVPSVVNGMILDTVATDGTQGVTASSPQVSQWSVQSSNSVNTGVNGTGSSRTGAPSVPVSETFSGTSNWSLGAVSINPSSADIGVTTSVVAVPLGQNSVYNITVKNNGPSAANNVVLTDTWASTGLSLVSTTPSTGTTCVTTAVITCTLPVSLASGATATVAVTVTASAAGFYSNTAVVTDSGTPPDPNTGNNTYVALAPVNNIVCVANTLSAGGTLSGTLNTYYPGTASVAAGATSIPVGVPTGAGTAIASGSLLLVIQMQDASISTTNTVAYGNGSTGSGFTALNNAGNYEFVKATGAVSGGLVPISGAGTASGLVFAYTAAAASAVKGQSTYQVVVVPQFLSATFNATTPPTALAWNGSTGGILALDISGTLNLNGATVAVDGMGFRGGAGLQLNGGVGGNNTDYQFPGPATYTGANENGIDGAKGEGVAGTPAWVESAGTYLATNSNYPSGVAGTDGSMARGAPGNAGGGGTDGDTPSNDQNAGGGGGGNGGSGGFGGDSWNSNLSSGGEGGAPFPATVNRIAMGGGGGAGSRNNSDGDTQASSAAAGGGIVFIRAGSLTGTGTITANGAASYNGTANDAGGGGGAGGTVIVLSSNGGESGLTLQAEGGNGGNAWSAQLYALTERHGPGGGGGGGVIFVSGTPGSSNVTGGVNGLTLNTPAVPYGATSGTAGTIAITTTLLQVTGILSSALCTPDLTLSKSHVGTFTRGTSASYTIPVSNIAQYGPTIGVVTVNDTLPTGISPIGAAGTGWTCSVSGQTVSCIRSDALAALGSYPSITLNASVLQSAPASLINVAVVGGGGEANLANDTATDTASVASTADLAISDSASPDPVAAGSNITYTQIATNNGPSAADNATVVLAIPANTTLVSFTAATGWSCTSPLVGGTGNVVCTNSNMPALTAASFNLVVKVNTGTANGTVISETSSAGSSASDPNSLNNTATATTIVGTTGPNLSVTNVDSPNPVQAGGTITYTQIVTNTGSSAATTATFTEATPTGTTFLSITPPAGWTCTSFPTVCTNPSVAPGTSGAFTVLYKVSATATSGTVVTDTVTVNAANQSFGANSATATDVVAAATQADLALTTTATPSSIFSGNNITYTQTVTNNGPGTSSGVSFTEAIPTNTTFSSVSAPAGWTCTVTTSVTCTTPTLASGATANILVVVDTASSLAAGAITANSSVTATTTDPTSANNSTAVTTPVTVACDLAVTVSGIPNPATAGANLVYTQTVTNSGPSNCSTATFSEPTPANTTFVSASVVTTGGGTWTCPNAAPIACTNPSVPPGSTATITSTYKVTAGTAAGTIITDTSTVATTSRDTAVTNNIATSTIAVASGTQADLSVTNSATPNPVSAGNNITYTQSVTNAGPAAAATVTFSDPVPANTTVVSLTGPAGWTCSIATVPPTCTITTLASGATANFTYVVKATNTVAAGTTIAETDSVSSATTADPNTANNSASVNTLVAGSADLSVTNVPNPVPVQANNNIIYTQVVTNAGPSTATTVSVAESLPANTTAVTLTGPAGWTCTLATLICTNPSLAPATPSTITFTVKVNTGTTPGTVISDTVNVNSATSDPNTVNNSATASDVVATVAQSDLVVANTATPTSTTAGSNVTFTQSVTNKGPAAASGATFTQTTPPNTTFQSITPPAGWVCGTKPAVGGTGTITCTDASNLAVNATANFSLVLQVNTATPTGTTIIETDSATSTNMVASPTTTASATVVVADVNSADVAIVKTATPNPVIEGTPLTYTLTVTNNGPASATTVTVADTLPSAISYLSSNTTQGSCSAAGGVVTCLLGTMANAATATITILTIPNAPGVVSNTATVAADQTDSNLVNNSSTQIETITYPTSITLQSFSAHSGTDKNGANRVVLMWRTGGEAHNLGFNVYREQNGNRVRMNSSTIAGSALLMSDALPKHSGRSYAWIDPSAGVTASSYWLEDIDVNGTRTLHGPVSVEAGATPGMYASAAETHMFSQLNQAQPAGGQESQVVENLPLAIQPTTGQIQKQFALAAKPAVKILVRHEGWYRVAQADLVAAGLDANVDPALLHLYAEAVEQPIQITGANGGPGGFGPQAAINFYGTGIDTPFSGTRVYWLAAGETSGARIQQMPASSGSNLLPSVYPATVELKQRTTYFAALLTTTGDNFFGALVSPAPLDQVLQLPNLDTTSSQASGIEVVLQGVITGYPHDVKVALNGTEIGDVTFTGQGRGRLNVAVPPGVLQPGSDTVTLTAQNGDYDTSLVDHIRITYPHAFAADSDQLELTGRAGDEINIAGFSSAPVVLDITDPNRPVLLTAQPATPAGSGNHNVAVAVQVPWSTTTTNLGGPLRHTLLAVANDRVATVAGIRTNYPSHWHASQAGADIAIVTYDDFAAALAPLVRAHQTEGKSSAVVPVTDLYDEFSFGERSPMAIRQFLQSAIANWKQPPTYLLLNGRASLDPRNYLGFGHLDLVPTQIVPTASLMTASDDWFSDFNGTGMPAIATGRLPVSTADEAKTVVEKIVSYESQTPGGPWTSRALMIADKDDAESFTQDSKTVQAALPARIHANDIFTSNIGAASARQDIIDAINSGQLLVNYLGHGSEEQWSGSDIFDTTAVGSLTNQSQLPVFLIMDCLNGFFQDVYSQPLAVTLLLAPNGGAVAVLASSGLNQPAPQTRLDKFVVQSLLNAARPSLGEVILKAKGQIADPGVRKTYVLFGDPAMRLADSAPAATH